MYIYTFFKSKHRYIDALQVKDWETKAQLTAVSTFGGKLVMHLQKFYKKVELPVHV